MQLAQPSWRMATQHSMRNKEEETKPKNLFLGYSSSMELVGGQQLPVRWGQVAFPSMGTHRRVTAAPWEVDGLHPLQSLCPGPQPTAPSVVLDLLNVQLAVQRAEAVRAGSKALPGCGRLPLPAAILV